MPSPGVVVIGADELRAAFRRAQGTTKDLRRAHREVGKVVERGSKRTGGNRQQDKAKKRSMLGKGNQRSAVLALRNTASMPFGIGPFTGSKAHPQFPDWVGNNWNLWEGEGPYLVAEAVHRDQDLILDEFEQAMANALRAAGLRVTE